MCHDSQDATAQFASFASDAEFRGMHPDPLATELIKKGKMVEFPVAGGANGHAYLVKSKRKTDKYLLLFHEWWGLNDYIKNEAAMWSKELGVHVLAVDLYDGKMATTADEAGKLMQGNDPVRSLAIIDGAAKYAGENANFRTMGWCFGGGWSLRAALQLKDKTRGCVVAKAGSATANVSGTDSQGFIDHTARCVEGTTPAAVIRTASSLAVICQSGPDSFSYRGERLSDGANLQIPTAQRSGNGFVATNPADGARYEVSPDGLTISSFGHVDSSEPPLEYGER